MKISEMKDAVFDGRNMGYVPPKKLHISPKLKLHRKSAKSIDPITYEVIRHSLWHVNEEHGATIQRLSGSPVAMYALDLNPSILTEDGEFVYFGPYMQYMSGVTDTQVKWVLEYRSENPGIREATCSSPTTPGGRRAPADVMLICRVLEGELFCWVTNCLHQYDLAASRPRPSAARLKTHSRRHLHPAGEDRGRERDPPRHRGAVPALIAQARGRGARLPRPARGNITARDRVLALIQRYGTTW